MNEIELEAVGRARLGLESSAFELRVAQQPEDARATGKSDKVRGAKWPLEPPPVIEFTVHDNDPHRTYLHSPFWFCTADIDHQNKGTSSGSILNGSLVSSLHKVKLSDNKEHGYFIFGDLNLKTPGTYRLKFTLFEMRQSPNGMYAARLNYTYSEEFQVHPSKTHVPVRESTPLSRTLCEAGVKLRIRKEPSKRKQQCIDWSADRAPGYWGMALLPLPGPMMAPSNQMMISPPHHGNHFVTGENVAHRLSYGSSALGIREHLNKEYGSNDQAPKFHERLDINGSMSGRQLWPTQGWAIPSSQSLYQAGVATSNGDLQSNSIASNPDPRSNYTAQNSELRSNGYSWSSTGPFSSFATDVSSNGTANDLHSSTLLGNWAGQPF